MPNKTYSDYYNNMYVSSGKSASGTGEWKIKEAMWREVGYEDWMSVLDYGCGWGAMFPAVNDRQRYVGVDISPQAIEIGKSEFSDVDFRSFTMGELALDKKFDFIVAMSVFTHVPHENVDECLQDIHRHMDPTGFGLIDILEGEDQTNHPYIHWWNLDEFGKVLDKNGFGSEFAKKIKWPGFEHTYLKIWS